MPFYTFTCRSCGEKFEVHCTIAEKDSGKVVCPGCGANELDRVFEGFSVSVKSGSGKAAGCPNAAMCPRAAGGCCGH